MTKFLQGWEGTPPPPPPDLLLQASNVRLEHFLNLNYENLKNITEIICWVKWVQFATDPIQIIRTLPQTMCGIFYGYFIRKSCLSASITWTMQGLFVNMWCVLTSNYGNGDFYINYSTEHVLLPKSTVLLRCNLLCLRNKSSSRLNCHQRSLCNLKSWPEESFFSTKTVCTNIPDSPRKFNENGFVIQFMEPISVACTRSNPVRIWRD